jgi:stress response protein YsnF
MHRQELYDLEKDIDEQQAEDLEQLRDESLEKTKDELQVHETSLIKKLEQEGKFVSVKINRAKGQISKFTCNTCI